MAFFAFWISFTCARRRVLFCPLTNIAVAFIAAVFVTLIQDESSEHGKNENLHALDYFFLLLSTLSSKQNKKRRDISPEFLVALFSSPNIQTSYHLSSLLLPVHALCNVIFVTTTITQQAESRYGIHRHIKFFSNNSCVGIYHSELCQNSEERERNFHVCIALKHKRDFSFVENRKIFWIFFVFPSSDDFDSYGREQQFLRL